MAGDTEVVNGHVDNMACFIRPGVVAISWTEDKTDPQYECSARNVEILENSTDAKGRKIEVIKVPCPPPMFRTYHEAATMDVSGGAREMAWSGRIVGVDGLGWAGLSLLLVVVCLMLRAKG